jgi:hypothetical protein
MVRSAFREVPLDAHPELADRGRAGIRMLNRDDEGFVTHFMLHARKQT